MANITTRVTNSSVAGAGTITTSTSSVTVTGSGTSFLTAVTIGQILTDGSSTTIGTVLSIQSNTSLTLVANAAVDLTNSVYNIVSTGITTKNAPLTNAEIDTNFINLNNAVVAGANSSVTNVANTLVKRGPSGEFSAGVATLASGTTVGGTSVPATNATQAQMEAGTDTTTRFMSAERIKQAIDVLALQGIGNISHDTTGFEDRAFSTISIDASTRVFTLTNNGTCNIWYRGKKFAISSPLTITLANTSGGRWITFNTTSSTLAEGNIGADPDIINTVLVAYVYLDVTNSTAVILGDERHLASRDVEWHLAQHNTIGAIWKSGGTCSATLNNQAANTLSFTSPIVFQDEDIIHSITHSASPNGNYQQNITGNAQLPVLYLNGTTYVQQAASSTPWILGTSRLRYNLISNGNGSLTDIGENQYVNYWIVATNDKTYPIKAIMGRNAYATLDAATTETLASYGLPWPEVVPMQMITLQSNGSWSLPTRSIIARVKELEYRKNISLNDFKIPKHSDLAQLETDDHPQYVHTSIARTITAAHTFTNNITFSSTGFIKIPTGTTAERPASPQLGMIRFNSTLGYMEQYTADGWVSIAPAPLITAVSPTTFSGAAGTTFTINGANFDTGVTIRFITNTGAEYTATTTTRLSSSQVTATTPVNFLVANEPLKVKVQNGTGLNYTLENAIDCGGSPTWNTASGTIATIFDRYGSYNPITTISASDPDGSAVTYSIVSGGLPSGCSLNSSNGQISGDPGDSDSSYTSTFTVRATDSVGNTSDRSFSIVVNPALDGSSAARGPNSGLALVQSFPSLASGTYWIKPNGNSAQQMYVDTTTEGGGYDFYQCSNCSATSYANQGSGCPAGMYYVYGRSRDHWSILLNRYGSGWMSNVGAVYKPNGGGNYTGCAMRNPTYYGGGSCGEWQVGDGGRWWIRNNTHGEPNGDYNGYGWQQIYFGTGLDPIGFNDGGAYSTGSSYICSTNAKG